MLNFLKSLFARHQFSIEPKFHEGDVCLWPGPIDGCDDAVVEITDWCKDYDLETDEELILYDFTDIYRHIDYSGVKEKELQLLAFNEEIMENISPYTLETLYRDAA